MRKPWPTYELNELVDVCSGGTPAKSNEGYWGGDVPWVSAKDLKRLRISSSIDKLTEAGAEAAGLVPKGTVLVLVRGMTLFRRVPVGLAERDLAFNQDIKGLRPRNIIDPEFLAWALCAQEPLLMRQVDNAGHGTGRLNTDALMSCPLPLPPLPTQRRISKILRTWDEAIEKSDRLIAAKSKRFDHWSLMLLSGRKRLGSKRTNWQSVALTDVTSEATTRNSGSLGKDVVMGVNKSLGMIPMRDHVRASDLSRYKIVAPEAFAYNPMRLNIGSIAQNLHGCDVLVSPDYVAFAVQSDSLMPGYFDHLRRSWLWSRFVKTAGSGGVRVRIYYDDLADFIFELPPVPEQRRIVDVLDTGRREIALLEQQRDAMSKQKRGLMQKLLTGEWPVSVPTTKEAAE